MNNLYDLLVPWNFCNSIFVGVTGMELDSRVIKHGGLFIAVKGGQTDGRLYIDHAISNGAVAVLSESLNYQKEYSCDLYNVPIIYVKYLNKYVSNIAGRFYCYPSYSLNVIGVTGTNGKTTVTYLLAEWVRLLRKKSAIMGTLGYGILEGSSNMALNTYPIGTTYSAIDTQKILSQFVKEKVDFVSMEVSSHGLDQHRVDALHFKVAIFTNLSRDHLDYHGNITNYMMAKWRLFNELCVENYIINADDFFGYTWLSYLSYAVAVTVTGVLPPHWRGKWICAVDINYRCYGADIVFHSSWGNGVIYSNLLGEFNVINLLLALGALLIIGYSLPVLLATACQLTAVYGRMEIFRSRGKYPTVIVDYAHTPDALKKVLILIKQYCFGKLWCIFGCGGDRDQGKRSLMGAVAERYSDYVVLTNDNPRTEDPQSIINDIIEGMTCIKTMKVIKDRVYAIRTVILQQALSEDVVLISGKGHENFQIIGKNCFYHSDRDIVKHIFKNN